MQKVAILLGSQQQKKDMICMALYGCTKSQ